jgi:hypothetical protein
MPKMNDCHDYAFQTAGSRDRLNLSKELPADTLSLRAGAHAEHPEVHMIAMKGQVCASDERFSTSECFAALRQKDALILCGDDVSDLIGIGPLTTQNVRLGCPADLG